jgi:hypothetical protein
MPRPSSPISVRYRIREQTEQEEAAYRRALDEFIEAFVRLKMTTVATRSRSTGEKGSQSTSPQLRDK